MIPNMGDPHRAEARAMARDILAEAERAAQDIVASAVKIKAEADRALEEARKQGCVHSEACSGGARACREHRQEPAHDRHVGWPKSRAVNDNGYSRTHPSVLRWAKHRDRADSAPPLS